MEDQKLRRAYDRLREEAERLRERDKAKDEFLGVAAHELKTPLAVLIGLSETMLMYPEHFGPEESTELLERMRNQAETLNALVDQLLDLSRASAGTVRFKEEKLPVAQIVHAVVDQLKPTMSTHKFVVEVDDEVVVLVDKSNFERILGNLLLNATKHSPQGSSIIIRSRHVEDDVTISVEDSGPGIPEEDQPRVFERLFRPDGARVQGNGMGVIVAARFVKMQGGQMWVDSVPGNGSTFTFTLTLAGADRRVSR